MEGPLEMLGTHRQSRGIYGGVCVWKEVMRVTPTVPSEVFPTESLHHLRAPSQGHHPPSGPHPFFLEPLPGLASQAAVPAHDSPSLEHVGRLLLWLPCSFPSCPSGLKLMLPFSH